MIPAMILFGLVLGRWWKTCLALAAVAWPALVLTDGSIGLAGIPGAAIIGLLNAAVGVAVTQAILWLARAIRHRRRSAASTA